MGREEWGVANKNSNIPELFVAAGEVKRLRLSITEIEPSRQRVKT